MIFTASFLSFKTTQRGTIYFSMVQTPVGAVHKKWGLGLFSIRGALLLTILSQWTLPSRNLQACVERAEGACQGSPAHWEPQCQALGVSWKAFPGD